MLFRHPCSYCVPHELSIDGFVLNFCCLNGQNIFYPIIKWNALLGEHYLKFYSIIVLSITLIYHHSCVTAMSYCCIISVIHHYSKVLPWGIASKMKPSSRKKIHQQPQYNYRIKGWWWNLIMIWPGSEWKLGEQKGWRENKRKIPKVLLSEGWVSKGKISSPFRATTLNCIQAELNSTGSHRREQKLGTGHKGPALNGTNPSWQIQHCLSPSWAGIHRQRDGVGLDLGRERASKKIPHSGVAGSRSQGSAVLRMW